MSAGPAGADLTRLAAAWTRIASTVSPTSSSMRTCCIVQVMSPASRRENSKRSSISARQRGDVGAHPAQVARAGLAVDDLVVDGLGEQAQRRDRRAQVVRDGRDQPRRRAPPRRGELRDRGVRRVGELRQLVAPPVRATGAREPSPTAASVVCRCSMSRITPPANSRAARTADEPGERRDDHDEEHVVGRDEHELGADPRDTRTWPTAMPTASGELAPQRSEPRAPAATRCAAASAGAAEPGEQEPRQRAAPAP